MQLNQVKSKIGTNLDNKVSNVVVQLLNEVKVLFTTVEILIQQRAINSLNKRIS
jgi:hypothetical protein